LRAYYGSKLSVSIPPALFVNVSDNPYGLPSVIIPLILLNSSFSSAIYQSFHSASASNYFTHESSLFPKNSDDSSLSVN